MKLKTLSRVFGFICVLAIMAVVSHTSPEAGASLAFIGLVAGMKAKNLTLTKEQEDFLNELDLGVEKSLKGYQEKAEALEKQLKELKEGDEKAKKELQDQLDELQAKMKDEKSAGAKGKSFPEELEAKLTEKKADLGNRKQFNFDLDRKAVGDMSSSNLTGSYFVQPDVRGGVVVQPYNQIHMRDLLPLGRTTSNIIRHIRDNGGEGGPETVDAGGTKPQMDRDLSIEDASVRKIATYLRIPEEMIEDIPYLTSFITNIGTEEVMAVEDTQILYGDGTGQNLSGLFTNATDFAAGGSTVEFPNEFDVLRAARKQMRKLKRTPSFALVSPSDYFTMTSAKDTTGNYILLGGGNGLVPTLDGVPIVEMNQVEDGDFLLGSRTAAEIAFRTNVNIRFYDQDRDNAIKNMVTIVIEERLALPIYYTNGFIKGTFEAGITALTAA